MGHARSARRVGGGERIGNHQGGHWHQADSGGVQRRLPEDGHALHLRVERAHPPNGILGRHGCPVRHLPHQVHGVCVVASCPIAQKGHVVQGLHHPALQPHGGNGTELARAQPARNVPRRQGHHHRGAIPRHFGVPCGAFGPSRPGRRRFAGRLFGVDDHALDVAFQRGPDGRTGHHLRGREDFQPLHPNCGVRHPGRSPRGQAIRGQESPGARSGGHIERPRSRGHALRGIARLGHADGPPRACVPGHSRGLCHHRGWHGHCTHRTNLRCG